MTHYIIERSTAVEEQIREKVEVLWKVSAKGTSRYHCCDYILYRDGRAIGVLEVKERRIYSGQYLNAVFDAQKAKKMSRFNLPMYVVFSFEDVPLWHRLDSNLSYETATMRVETPLSGTCTKTNLLIPVKDCYPITTVPEGLR